MVDIQDSFGIEPMANCGLFALSTCNSGYVPVSVDINRYQFLVYTLIKTTGSSSWIGRLTNLDSSGILASSYYPADQTVGFYLLSKFEIRFFKAKIEWIIYLKSRILLKLFLGESVEILPLLRHLNFYGKAGILQSAYLYSFSNDLY